MERTQLFNHILWTHIVWTATILALSALAKPNTRTEDPAPSAAMKALLSPQQTQVQVITKWIQQNKTLPEKPSESRLIIITTLQT